MSATIEGQAGETARPSTPQPPGRTRRRWRAAGEGGGKRGRLMARWTPYLFLLAAIIMELAIHIVPMLFGIWVSFLKLNRYFIANWRAAPFIGLDNYKLVTDFSQPIGEGLLKSFGITIAFTILVVGMSWVCGMCGAVVLQRTFRGQKWLRTLFLIPYALPMYAGIITWNFMLQRDTGVINYIIVDMLHLTDKAPFWLIGPNAFVSIVVVALWRMWPFAFLMMMAGLQSIPDELYEAAEMDGAGMFSRWRQITLPMLRPVNVVLILVMFLWTFNDFTTPFVLFGSSSPPAGDLISFHIYNASFLTWNFGTGSAMSVLLLLFLLLVTGAYLLFINRRSRRA